MCEVHTFVNLFTILFTLILIFVSLICNLSFGEDYTLKPRTFKETLDFLNI